MSERGDCTCPRCDGHGSVPRPGWPRRIGFTCPECDGTGVDLDRPAPCRHPIEARIAHGPHYYQSCGRCGEDVP